MSVSPDSETSPIGDSSSRRGWPSIAEIVTVAIGGAFGVAAREAIVVALPVSEVASHVAILAINVVGAFLLGVLAQALLRRGADTGRRRCIRLLLGTGVLGGFTTYSTLAVDGVLLLGTNPGLGIAYAVGTVALGAVATVVGIVVGTALAGSRGDDDRPRARTARQ